MTRKTLSPIGGLQPFLFCIGMYFVALFFSIFVCSSIFYVVNSNKTVKGTLVEKTNAKTELASIK